MGYNDSTLRKVRGAIEIMKSHPNYTPLTPNEGETLLQFTLRWASHLVSPPQEPGESYDLECTDVALAIRMLENDITKAWNKYYNIKIN